MPHHNVPTPADTPPSLLKPDSIMDPEVIARITRESTADTEFVDLLRRANISLVAALRPGGIACIGVQDGALFMTCTPMVAPLGLATDGTRLAVGSRRDITVFTPSTRLADHLPGQPKHHDVLFVPVNSYRTGECMVHDMALDGPSVVFINTQFSCLARADGLSSFVPLWRPPFITTLMPEDRCHLNSFAMEGNRIRYATAFAATDAVQGYRSLPNDSGVIIDVEANAVVVTGLIKPHSVRIFDSKLYVLNSASGEVLKVDINARGSETLATLPGFTRGLRLHGDVLFVGLSTLRASARVLGLPLGNRADSLVAGIAALDRNSGQLLGMLRLAPGVEELFDLVVLPGFQRPLMLDPSPDVKAVGIETPDGSYWMTVGQDLRPRPPDQAGSQTTPKPVE
jgi:uncharacterized protein (TIGR03032 family)